MLTARQDPAADNPGSLGLESRAAGRRGPRRTSLWRSVSGVLFMAPALVVLLVFWLVPLVLVVVFSLFHWDYGTNPDFVGTEQYHIVLSDPLFLQAVLTTLVFAAVVVAVGTAFSLLVAVVLYGEVQARGLFRSLVFLPYVMPMVATSTIWLWMFQPGSGVVDRLMHAVGLPGQVAWLNSSTLALAALCIYTVWYGFGFTTLLFTAGLTAIPSEVLNAGLVDGAGTWQRFRYLVWPLLTPTTLFVVVVNTISSFQAFTQIYALTRGGPVNATTTLTYYIYETAFTYFHFGAASASAVVLFVFVVVLTATQFLLSRRYVFYDEATA
ncbi:MAG: sugar ABC transporter permease [Actinomycetota bacterium]|jgi:ABC-type sugar transport system permease subunit|nr:sugar ABC transporter permease [Actinomycetota bacterium]MDA8301453.1 sugar ABC transporter permease [Actinomycetota bacterium]